MHARSVESRKDTNYTRHDIEDLIAQGRHIIIVDGYVLKVDSWLRFHPGGDKAIMHMVGRDATDEVNACVSPFGYSVEQVVPNIWPPVYIHRKQDKE